MGKKLGDLWRKKWCLNMELTTTTKNKQLVNSCPVSLYSEMSGM